MRTVTIKEFKDWFDKQPKDRPVSMGQNIINDPCGCLMVQWGRENLTTPFRHCTNTKWVADNEFVKDGIVARFEHNNIGWGIFGILKWEGLETATTFGDIKFEDQSD